MRAFVINEVDGEFHCGLAEAQPVPRDAFDILVKVDFSGINYKDVLVARAESRVRRAQHLVGGIDAAGTVTSSSDSNFPVGSRVVVHGHDMGVGRDGGFAEYVYAPSSCVNLLPHSLSTHDAMVIGTAGFAAMASVLALESHGLAQGDEVLVTGATGGVGSLAVTFLAARGYRPVASTGSPVHASWLEDRGAVRVIGRDDISDRPDRVLGSERWAGAIDCIGGVTLHQILRSLRYGAGVAASGLVADTDLNTTIYPFITRAVNLLGIDVVEATHATRDAVWATVGDVAPRVEFAALVDRSVTLGELTGALEAVRTGSTRGRIVVDLTRE